MRIWCDATFDTPAQTLLDKGTAGHDLAVAARGAAPAFSLAEADIAFGQPDPDAVIAATGLRWIHIASAGYTRYDRDDFRNALRARGAHFTNSSHVFDEPCAQHVLAMMLGLARHLPQAYERQLHAQDWTSGERRGASYLLNGQAVLLLGFGAIGHRLVQLLAPFAMQIKAVRRQAQGDEGIEIVAEADLDAALAAADHVVNILPESPASVGFVNARRLSRMKRGAMFYNIGRGATVDQDALLSALQEGRLGGAYLDVTTPEPLPLGHPLWTAPNCYITPHTAGGHRGEQERLVRHFLANLRAFEKGEPLRDQVI